MSILKTIAGVYLGIVVVSAALGLLGLLIGLSFGIFGALTALVLRLVFHPISVVLAALYLLYRFHTRRA